MKNEGSPLTPRLRRPAQLLLLRRGKTMNDAFDIRGESHIEVHKFRAGAIIAATLLALLFQSSYSQFILRRLPVLDLLCW